MTVEEAQKFVRSVEGVWRCDFGEDGRRIWRERMMRYDNELASTALALLADRQRQQPTIADMRQMIAKLEADERSRQPGIPEPKAEKIPDWVLVWRWVRFQRDPVVELPLPQQKPNHRPPYMSDDDYMQYHGEWVAAGCPGRTLRPSEVLPGSVTKS